MRSELKFWRLIKLLRSLLNASIDLSSYLFIFTYLGLFLFDWGRSSKLVKYGKWSDNNVCKRPDLILPEFRGRFEDIWSIRVPRFLENLVGWTICGKNPLVTKRSKYSWILILLSMSKRFMLKSPEMNVWDLFWQVCY